MYPASGVSREESAEQMKFSRMATKFVDSVIRNNSWNSAWVLPMGIDLGDALNDQ